MKKSNLLEGLVFAALGVFLILMVLIGPWESSLISGLGGGCLGGGAAMLGKYVYWASPKRAGAYAEHLEEERILLQDELLARLRDRAGRIAYLLGLAVISAGIVILGALKELGVLADVRLTVLCLGAYFLFQLIAGAAAFSILKKRY